METENYYTAVETKVSLPFHIVLSTFATLISLVWFVIHSIKTAVRRKQNKKKEWTIYSGVNRDGYECKKDTGSDGTFTDDLWYVHVKAISLQRASSET